MSILTILKKLVAQEGITNPVLPWLSGKGRAEGGSVLGEIISVLLGLFLIVAGLLSFSYLVQGGIQWITSSGDKAGLEAARNKIIHAMVGMILVASSWAFITLILDKFLGISFPILEIPRLGDTP